MVKMNKSNSEYYGVIIGLSKDYWV